MKGTTITLLNYFEAHDLKPTSVTEMVDGRTWMEWQVSPGSEVHAIDTAVESLQDDNVALFCRAPDHRWSSKLDRRELIFGWVSRAIEELKEQLATPSYLRETDKKVGWAVARLSEVSAYLAAGHYEPIGRVARQHLEICGWELPPGRTT